MNKKQETALTKLNAAFKTAKDAGLIFFGMDDRLLAYDETEYARSEVEHDDPLNECEHEPVETHGAYKDSGGF